MRSIYGATLWSYGITGDSYHFNHCLYISCTNEESLTKFVFGDRYKYSSYFDGPAISIAFGWSWCLCSTSNPTCGSTILFFPGDEEMVLTSTVSCQGFSLPTKQMHPSLPSHPVAQYQWCPVSVLSDYQTRQPI